MRTSPPCPVFRLPGLAASGSVLVAATCWAVPLLVAEVVMQGRAVFQKRT